MAADSVPKHLLDSANRTIGKLQKQLDEALLESRREMEEATASLQNQLRVVQNQQRMAEDQLHRSMQRERELRAQASNADVTAILGKLRADLEVATRDNKELREELEGLHACRRDYEDLKRKMEGLQLENEAMESGHVLELRKAQAEAEKLRQALAEADAQLVQTVEAKDREFKQVVKDKESILRTQQEELQELHDALTESHDILAATDQVSNQYSGRIHTLEMELKHARSQIQENTKHMRDMERRCSALEEQIEALEADLVNEQDLTARLTTSVNTYETELVTIQGQSASSHEELTKKCYTLAAEVEDMHCKLSEAQADVKKAESDLKEAKDKYRKDLSDAENENKHLRSTLREERDLLEKTMREHSATVTDQLETQQRLEHSAVRREEGLQRRLQQVEEENESLRKSSVPEDQIRRMQHQIVAEKEAVQARLEKTLEELKAAERALALSKESLQLQIQKAQHETALANQQIQPLQQQLQDALMEAGKEKRLNTSLQEQVKLLTGGTEGLQPSGETKLSKVAETALRSLTEEHRRCIGDPTALAANGSGIALNASHGGQQRTALGIVLRETMVEAVVPGSPADMSGRVAARDELLMVDGRSVSAATAMAALRGNDAEGTVVTIVLRSAQGGEAVEVRLARENIGRVRELQATAEEAKQLEQQAEQAIGAGQLTVLEDRLKKLAALRRNTQRSHLEDLCRLGAWATALKESVESVVVKGRQGVMRVDACHQRVHTLQNKLEEELRADLGRVAVEGGALTADSLHRTIQQLEGAVKLQQEEMKGLQMLVSDAEEREAKEAESRRAAEERARTLEGVQSEMSKRMASLNAQTGAALAEMKQFPAVVAVRLGGVGLAKGREKEAKAAVEQQLQAEVAVSLQAPPQAVQVMCSYGEEEWVALIKLAAPEAPTALVGSQRMAARDGRALAEELMGQVEDAGSVLRGGGLGECVRGAQMHGPISELTARSLRLALAARDREWQWVEQELQVVRGRFESEATSKTRESEVMAVETEARVKAAREGGRAEARDEMTVEMDMRLREQEESIRALWDAEVAEGREREGRQAEEVAALHESCAQKDSHVRALQGLLADLQARLEVVEEELHAAEDGQRHADHERARNAEFALQMRKLVGPEVRACLTTLGNVESEMGFFHAYQMRALSIAGCMGGLDEATAATIPDAAHSKEMIEKDLKSLREQLEEVLALTGRTAGVNSVIALHSSSRGPSPPPGAGQRSEKDGESRTSSSTLWAGSGGARALGSAVEVGAWQDGGMWDGRRAGGVSLLDESAVKARYSSEMQVRSQRASGSVFGAMATADALNSTPAKALPTVPPVSDVAGRFGAGASRTSATPSPSKEVRLSPPLSASGSPPLREGAGQGSGSPGSLSGRQGSMPRVLTPLGKQPFVMRVTVLEASEMPEGLGGVYLCGCLSVLPRSLEHSSLSRTARCLVPQHRTLPASGEGRVVWEGARELSFSRSRILCHQHANDGAEGGGGFAAGPKHVDFSLKGDRRRGVEVVATEELRGQTVVLLLTLHTAGADAGSNGTVARCLVSIHRGMDGEQWYSLEAPDGSSLQNKAAQHSTLRVRISYLPGSSPKSHISDGSHVPSLRSHAADTPTRQSPPLSAEDPAEPRLAAGLVPEAAEQGQHGLFD